MVLTKYCKRDLKIYLDLLVRAFITYVRPLLEYNSVTGSPHLKCDTEHIEKVQRRFTKRLHGFTSLMNA